ncbi:unnamed protein product [Gongylonema pulchrum]|uniref:Coatomer subunit zeta n=1 Tax=Gongylonema pulchrum TaxID=637853 RepID=A0A183DHB2_9BILA|nr:unnamed protein product [Gongylonema pulchrum]
MEPSAEQTVRQFLKCNGEQAVVIDLLVNSYYGYSELCNLLSEFLVLMEGTEEGARKCIENTLSTLIRRNFVAETIDAKFEVAENVDAWLPELLENR